MPGIPLTRCKFLAPFATTLDEIGAPTTSLLTKFHLPTQLYEKPKHYVPLLPALSWVTTAAESQGITDFGFLAGRQLGFEALSDRFQATVQNAPTLLSALRSWSRYIQLEDNVLQIRLVRHEQDLRICFTNTSDKGNGMPHLEHAQWLQNLMAIYVIRQFISADWKPETFAFQAHYRPSAETRSFWPNTRFLSGQRSNWIDVPVSHLGLPCRAGQRTPGRSGNRLPPFEFDTVQTLKLMLLTYLDEHVPTISEVAEIMGTSVRSVQRELSASDLTYSQLRDHVRFARASEMLRETDAKITDVAFATGYENPTHFTRAFHRIAGVTPRQFRQFSS